MQKNDEEAVTIYKKILEKSPDHVAARFYLACLLMQQEKISDALAEFLTLETQEPDHVETQINLATCYLKKGALNEAKKHYLNALSLTPDDTQILFNLGVIHRQQGNTDLAIQYYQRAIAAQPDLFSAHNNLGVAFLEKEHVGFALHHFQKALALQPDNKAITYTVTALTQNKRLLAAPTDYVQALFDAYADHYESHLLEALDYKIPEQLQQTLSRLTEPRAALDILDLGCGTGLCGVVLKPYAKTLIGVDLSEKMLAIAFEKKSYDQLIAEDIMHFLTDKKAQYDLMVAGDVLVYIGQLDALFVQITQSLRVDGLFIFNTEISDEQDYKMNQSGRFAHNKNYLAHLAEKNKLAILSSQLVITRMQHNGPVRGHLSILQKKN
ncbi:MAG TPA: tetratricopeptide repeat protein [Gammaproteobacteria bacterium]|nr:tetratricopeptide repeat protein [Gammaproteobacteria bacterium]